MDIALAFILSFIMLLLGVYKGIYIGYPLTAGIILFILVGMRKGFSIKQLLAMAYKGGKKSFIVIEIFILIGGITGIWMAAGTVPAMVYYGMKFLRPNLFILSAFLISCLVSFLIGTSFGTVSTAGIALIVVARGGGVSPVVTAGAIIAGIYFGDRCSPMSSSANLIANLTETDLYINIRRMFKTSIVPFFLATIIYFILSYKYPLNAGDSSIINEIGSSFYIGTIVIIPAIVILILSFFKINVKVSMAVSIIVALLISIFVQDNGLKNSLKYIFLGYSMDGNTPLKDIIKGGGVLSMIKSSIVVFISSAFTGIFEGTSMLKYIDQYVDKAKTRSGLFLTSILASIFTGAFGCSQTLAVILTHMLVKDTYEKNGIDKYELASDLENTAIVISPLIPWNIALLIPLTTLEVGASAIVYSFYLYFIPLINLIYLTFRDKKYNKFLKYTVD
ncbi:Na+/H+ antiporter NhaC family protein [uncultured Clostridium sp.]|uniref:Na+/H+ antiporter NhaC family protein n=1 Tax=uncultured Clostridium sp. TaxID=59620 RepID=UPI0028EE3D6B|nr:Na+/H+ antiporter NhaC family protein [uncultured Clostridium sp.]